LETLGQRCRRSGSKRRLRLPISTQSFCCSSETTTAGSAGNRCKASPPATTTFIEERGIDYRLFSDPQNGVAEDYGIVNDLDGMAGISEPRPAAFLIDEERRVQYAWVAQKWPDFPDYDEIKDELAAL
jgi:hypothetical protein